jgi:DNA/RNA endonuclease YhcR with UshA esterase domain
MKSWFAIALIIVTIAWVGTAPALAGQKADSTVTVPKYDPAAEKTFKGTVIDVVDRVCPMSGGLGSHLMLKLDDGSTIEVHLAATKFVKSFDLVFNKGDKIEVVGVKVQFEGKETIFAREVERGSDTFTFRDKDGVPVW